MSGYVIGTNASPNATRTGEARQPAWGTSQAAVDPVHHREGRDPVAELRRKTETGRSPYGIPGRSRAMARRGDYRGVVTKQEPALPRAPWPRNRRARGEAREGAGVRKTFDAADTQRDAGARHTHATHHTRAGRGPTPETRAQRPISRTRTVPGPLPAFHSLRGRSSR